MDTMDTMDTPCPQPARRKRQRGISPSPEPEPTILLDDDVDQFTTDLSNARYGGKPPNSLAVAPKRRRLPGNQLLQAAMGRKRELKGPEDQAAEMLKAAKDEFLTFTRQRRVSTRLQASRRNTIGDESDRSTTSIDLSKEALTFPSPISNLPANLSVLSHDISTSDMDSTSTTIAPRSSPNVSSVSITETQRSEPVKPPTRGRRRISQILAKRAVETANKKATLPARPKTKPSVLPDKGAKKNKTTVKALSKPKPTVPSRSRQAAVETSSTVPSKTRQALKPTTRGMNPTTRAVQTDSEKDKPKKAISAVTGRLRLSKPTTSKALSDTEFTKRKATVNETKPASHITRKSASSYPKLDVSLKPELYDPSWMNTQEEVLAELLNEVLLAGTSHPSAPEDVVRMALVDIYSTEKNIALFDRLKASILHGALKPSDDYLDQHLKLGDDLGLREKFTQTFTQTFNLQYLRLSMEIVTGRSIGVENATEADVARFFETFFIDIEDDEGNWESYGSNAHGSMRLWSEGEAVGSKAWALRRTILRSLQLIQLLDNAKTSNTFTDVLFQTTAESKNTEAVLNRIFMIILPTVGNPMRILRNCNYTISHVQLPEDEYYYGIKNIKVDLRSGTRLAKLAELLSPSAVEAKAALKSVSILPRTKADKVANVSVVLNYLYTIGCLPHDTVKPADIVDGHREVTLSVLWALIAGKVGLRRLVDWKDIHSETRRLWRKYKLDLDLLAEEEDIEDSGEEEKLLLRRLELWVHGITAPRNIKFGNPSTTFTNGEIVTAILDEYHPLSDVPVKSFNNDRVLTVFDRLRSIGCSTGFLALFTPNSAAAATSKGGRIVNSNFIIATLAFLASKILSSTRKTRAALKIQRFWRTISLRIQATQHLARIVEETRAAQAAAQHEREVRAAMIIQRAWRAAVARRIEDVTRTLTSVQALARGVLVRRKIDYSFRAGAKQAIRAKPLPSLVQKDEADPYSLRHNKTAGEDSILASDAWNLSTVALSRKGSKKSRKLKAVEAIPADVGGDIWQDLADVGEFE